MSGVPTGWLVTIALVATLVAALLAAGETGVLRASFLPSPARSETGPAVRRRRLMDDAHVTAEAGAGLGLVCEVVAAVSLTLALAGIGLVWWQVALGALVLLGVVGLVVVRFIPRALGRRFPVGTVAVTARLLGVARVLARPLRAVVVAEMAPVGDAELREMVDRAKDSEAIEDDEREMFRSVLELGDTITRAVMVPRTEMITLSSGTPVRSALSLFLRSGFSRVPLIGESVDDLLGVVYLKDVVRRRHTVPDSDGDPVDSLARPPVFVPESKPVDELLRELQQGLSHMAMVVDEFGGIAGLVTVEDALEEIVGELTDEHDRTGPEVEGLPDGRFRVPSRLPLDELGDLFGIEIEDDDVDTAGGLLAKALGKVPLAGSSGEVAGLRLTAERVEGRRKQLATLVVQRALREPTTRGDQQ